MDYRLVPENLRERDPLLPGRPPTTQQSKDLLGGKTIFKPNQFGSWGSLYNLAKNNGMKCHTQRVLVNGVEGTLIYFANNS